MMKRVRSAAIGAWQLARENGLLPIARFAVYRSAGIDALLPLRIGGVDLVLRTSNTDLSVARHCLIDEEFSVAKHLNHREGVSFVVDAGGYIGTAAIAFAGMFPQATVVTLEPSKENFDVLVKNVSQFKNIVPLRAALVGIDRDVTLYNRGTGDWGFTLLSNQAGRDLTPLGTVPGISISSLMQLHGKDRVDVLKLDIEGGEKEVLEQSSEWMPKLGAIFVELHDRIAPGCTDAFMQATVGMAAVELQGEKRLAVRPT